MKRGRTLLALWMVGSFFLVLCPISTRGDLIISGFHGVRIYDEVTGAFWGNIGTGEEQEGMVFGKDGRLYVLVNDLGGGWISKYSKSYGWEGSIGPHSFTGMPLGMCRGPDGNFYVGGNSFLGMKGGVRLIDGKTGADLGVFVAEGEGGLSGAFDLIFGPDGNLYVSNWGGAKVMRFDGKTGESMGDFISPGSGGLEGSTGMAFGPNGNLYVSSETRNKVLRYDGGTGEFIDDFVVAESGGLKGPAGLAFGPDGNLYVCSRGNHAVLRYDGKSGAFIDVFVHPGSGGLDNGPNYIVFTPRPPKLKIAQTAEGTLVSWGQEGCILESASGVNGMWERVTPSGECTHFISREPGGSAPQRFFRLKEAE